MPQTNIVQTSWNLFEEVGALGRTISGSGLFTLTDDWFICRYRPEAFTPLCTSVPNPEGWSAWTNPASPGWIKRVLAGINPFDGVWPTPP